MISPWQLLALRENTAAMDVSTNLTVNNNNYNNLYGAVTRPYYYKGASQATILGKPQQIGQF